ncbi:MAG: EAL domain-containing protein [Lachnospiraceae bacterium]|nr:EAL domain-containing protein [Lachnospiraceae bacterium]
MGTLRQLKIEYVFQSIFDREGNIYAREALMRPQDMTVTQLIEKYFRKGKLHVLEVATFFGATQAFFMRGYTEKLSINSFPCEIFTKEEVKAYMDYYGKDNSRLIIELLEYPIFSEKLGRKKRQLADLNANQIAIDDFGNGFNDYSVVSFTNPDIIKIDRSLLVGIDHDLNKQNNCKAIIDTFHLEKRLVLAEGIETEAEYTCLMELGADLFQGYYLDMPH